MRSSKIFKFLLAQKSLYEKRDGVLTTEVTSELLSCPAWTDVHVYDDKYSW